MPARKTSEFYELFRRSGQPEDRRQPRAGSQPRSEGAGGHHARRTYGFTKDKLAAMGAGAAVLVVVAFLLGLLVGGAGSRQREGPSPGPSVTEREADGPEQPAHTEEGTTVDTSEEKEGPAQEPGSFYKLRVIAGISRASAADIVEFLRRKGYEDVEVRKGEGAGYRVYVGRRFASKDTPEATALLEELQKTKYNDRLEFKDSYFVEFKRTEE